MEFSTCDLRLHLGIDSFAGGRQASATAMAHPSCDSLRGSLRSGGYVATEIVKSTNP